MKDEIRKEVVELFFGARGSLSQMIPSEDKLRFGQIVRFCLSEDRQICWMMKDHDEMVGLNKLRLAAAIDMLTDLYNEMRYVE